MEGKDCQRIRIAKLTIMVLKAAFLRHKDGANKVKSTMTLKEVVKLRPIIRVLIIPLIVIARMRVNNPKVSTDPFVTSRNFLSLMLGTINFL